MTDPRKPLFRIAPPLLGLTAVPGLGPVECRTRVTIQADSPGKPISKDLFGIFFVSGRA